MAKKELMTADHARKLANGVDYVEEIAEKIVDAIKGSAMRGATSISVEFAYGRVASAFLSLQGDLFTAEMWQYGLQPNQGVGRIINRLEGLGYEISPNSAYPNLTMVSWGGIRPD